MELSSLLTLIVTLVIIYWVWALPTSKGVGGSKSVKACIKKYYQEKVARVDNEFGRGTWKNFIKGDLKETQQVVKNTLSKKIITPTEYSKLEELLDEMEIYINNNAQQGSNIELDEEIILLRKINREKVKTRLKEMGRIK